jgi:hypothetical protein
LFDIFLTKGERKGIVFGRRMPLVLNPCDCGDVEQPLQGVGQAMLHVVDDEGDAHGQHQRRSFASGLVSGGRIRNHKRLDSLMPDMSLGEHQASANVLRFEPWVSLEDRLDGVSRRQHPQ